MALASIVTSLIAALETTSGISSGHVHVPAPEVPLVGSDLPALVAEIQPFTVMPSNQSIWHYPVDLTYLHTERTADIALDLTAVYPMPKAIVDALNAHATLAGQVYGMAFADPSGEIGALTWRGHNYSGCVVHLLLKEKYATTFVG